MASASAQKADSPYRFGRPNQLVDPAQPAKFRFLGIPSQGAKASLITHIQDVSWDDSYAILTGQMTLTSPDPTITKYQPYFDLREGNLVVCHANEGSGWYELWRMRVKEPGFQVQPKQWTYSLQNDLALLDASRDSFHYKKDHQHPKGWLGHEIIENVCARYHVPIGDLYVSKLYVKRIGFGDQRGLDWSNVSPLDVIRWVVWHEARNGRRLVVKYLNGKLNVVPFQRSPRLYGLGAQLLDASFQTELPPWFVTAIQMRGIVEGRDGSGLFPIQSSRGVPKAKVQKAHVLVRSDPAIKKYGYVRVFKYSPDATSDAMLRDEGKLFLAYAARPLFSASLTAPGIPRIQRGDAIVLGIGTDAMRKQLCWVKSAQHSLTAGSYQTVVNVQFQDPYVVPKGKRLLQRLRDTAAEATGIRQLYPPGTLSSKSDNTGRANQPVVPIDPSLLPGQHPGAN